MKTVTIPAYPEKPRTRRFYAFAWRVNRAVGATVRPTKAAIARCHELNDGPIVTIELPLPEVRRGK